MSQPVEDDAGELRVSVLPFEEFLADQDWLHGLTIGQPEKHSAVVVAVRGTGFVCFQTVQPMFQLLPESGRQEDDPTGGIRFGGFQDQKRFAALTLILKGLQDAPISNLAQRFLLDPLHGFID